MNLTDKTIRTVTRPMAGKTDQCFWDSDLPGFGLRIRASGARTWLCQYDVHGRSKRISLGSPAVVPAAAARAKAKELLAVKQLGGDPAGDKARARADAAKTLGALLPQYLEWKKPRLKPRPYAETLRHLNKHLAPLHREPIAAVTRAMISQRLGELSVSSGPGEATRARSSWSAFFKWACCEGLVNCNEVAYTNKPREDQKRDRVVTDSEIAAIWLALGDDTYAAIVRLLILTGARRGEIAGLECSEIDLDAALITLPKSRTKNSRQHLIPLSRPALAILKAQMQRQPTEAIFGSFDGFSLAKKAIDENLGAMPKWVLHDFRRSLSTGLNERFAVPAPIVETILGHASGHKSGVAGVYNHAEYLDQRRDALERWAAHIMRITGGNVVTMGAAA